MSTYITRKYKDRFHPLLVEYGGNAKVLAVRPLDGRGVITGMTCPERLERGTRRLLNDVLPIGGNRLTMGEG